MNWFIFSLTINCSDIKKNLFLETKDAIIKKLSRNDFHIFDKNDLKTFDFILIEKTEITLRREYNNECVKQRKIPLVDILDRDKFIKRDLFYTILQYFTESGPRVLRIVIGDQIPKLENFLVENFNYFIYEKDNIYSLDNVHHKIPYDEVIVEQFSGFNHEIKLDDYFSKWLSHSDFYLNCDIHSQDSKIIIRTKFSDYNLSPLFYDFLRRVFIKNLIDINKYPVLPKYLPILDKESKVFDFMCNRIDLNICMMFYIFYDSTVENFFYRTPQDYILIKNDNNEFLKIFDIQIKPRSVEVNNQKISIQESDLIKRFVQVYYEILPSEYEVAFYLFNSTRCTRVYEIVMDSLLQDTKERILFLYILNTMGFIRESELKALLKCKKHLQYSELNERIKEETKYEINKFIYEDIYKVFVILYYLKLSEELRENNELQKIFDLTNNKDIMKYILSLPIQFSMREYTQQKKRDLEINLLFDTNLFYLIKHSLEAKNAIVEARGNIVGKILNITELALGNKTEIKDNSKSLITSFNHKDTEENREIYSVEDVYKAIEEAINE